MSSPWIFISPASRGIGHALTRHLLRNTCAPLVVTARRDLDSVRSHILGGLGGDGVGKEDLGRMDQRLQVFKLDVTDERSISECASRCRSLFPPKSHHLHLAWLIPGILHPEKSPAQIDAENALSMFRVNTLGPMLLAKHFTQFLPRKATPAVRDSEGQGLPSIATMALMSARVGSISDNRLGGWYSYRSSKAAVNQLVKSLDIFIRNSAGDKAMVLSLHPGTVKTELSRDFWDSVGERGLLQPDQAAKYLYDVVLQKASDGKGRGGCWDWKGEEIQP